MLPTRGESAVAVGFMHWRSERTTLAAPLLGPQVGLSPAALSRLAASLRADNSPQPKEAQPLSHALTSIHVEFWLLGSWLVRRWRLLAISLSTYYPGQRRGAHTLPKGRERTDRPHLPTHSPPTTPHLDVKAISWVWGCSPSLVSTAHRSLRGEPLPCVLTRVYASEGPRTTPNEHDLSLYT
jgi:hypothetical protein